MEAESEKRGDGAEASTRKIRSRSKSKTNRRRGQRRGVYLTGAFPTWYSRDIRVIVIFMIRGGLSSHLHRFDFILKVYLSSHVILRQPTIFQLSFQIVWTSIILTK